MIVNQALMYIFIGFDCLKGWPDGSQRSHAALLNYWMNCDLTLGWENSKLRLLRETFDLDPSFIAMGLIVESKLMPLNKSLLQG